MLLTMSYATKEFVIHVLELLCVSCRIACDRSQKLLLASSVRQASDVVSVVSKTATTSLKYFADATRLVYRSARWTERPIILARRFLRSKTTRPALLNEATRSSVNTAPCKTVNNSSPSSTTLDIQTHKKKKSLSHGVTLKTFPVYRCVVLLVFPRRKVESEQLRKRRSSSRFSQNPQIRLMLYLDIDIVKIDSTSTPEPVLRDAPEAHH